MMDLERGHSDSSRAAPRNFSKPPAAARGRSDRTARGLGRRAASLAAHRGFEAAHAPSAARARSGLQAL